MDRTAFGESHTDLLVLHHPPVLIGVDKMDAIGLKDGPEFLGLIARYEQVRLVYRACASGFYSMPWNDHFSRLSSHRYAI
ncbi:hypothetical protein [Synechococcus elongatus]|uniref:hypothetical protein n=1 Tax=Synechococcus elongatus TaxID=32046 RepID=UPI0030CCF47A